jgi:hypothetical protein
MFFLLVIDKNTHAIYMATTTSTILNTVRIQMRSPNTSAPSSAAFRIETADHVVLKEDKFYDL